jgi:putative aldouronate transport system substrate-binding protein
MSKSISSVVALLVIISVLLMSCAGAVQPSAPAAEGESQAAAGPIKVRIFSPQDPNQDLETNSFSLEAEEMLGVDFEWETTTYDGPAAREKRQISLASGDYPDVYMLIPWIDGFSDTELLKYGKEGVILPLNDLIEQHAPNIKAALEEYPYLKAAATAPDGNIYGMPQLVQCYHCTLGNKMWVNSKWLETLGIEPPKTTEEFRAMLQAFKTKDPNGNGKADEVSLSGSIEDYGVRIIPYLMNGFIYNDNTTYLILDENNKVDLAANKPEWKEGLAYIKSLYDEGLIDPGAFTQNADAFKTIGSNAEAELLGAAAGMHPAIFTAIGPEEYGADYDVLPPLTGPYASYASFGDGPSPGGAFVLTNKASPEVQVAMIKLVDYFFTEEGQLRGHYGEEGVDWRRPQEGDVALNKEVEPIFAQIPMAEGEAPHNSNWGAAAQYFQPKTFRDGWVQSTDPVEYYDWAGYERRLQDATDLYAPHKPENPFPYWSLWIDPNVADEYAMLRQNITDFANQNSLQFITGDKNLEADWDAYVEGLDALGLARYLEILQQAYDASYQQ